MGGPVFGLKKGIDSGFVVGPRIWPAGAFISQTGGHGDFRPPNLLPARPNDFSFSEQGGAAAIADSPDMVRKRAREQLALGASHLKLMAGGGVSSLYDPLDVTQYSIEELRVAVEAAENWGTYVAVHAYTPRAVEVLRMATSGNAELLALSGLRSPYQGKLGVVEEGALADLILVDGDPIEDMQLVAQPETSFVVIMKDGKVFKNILK
jgi:imidazolonepropionase-like amidohydrolase